MIIFLYGQDTYRLRQKLNEIINHYKKIHEKGLDLKYLDLSEKTFEDFKNEFQTVSMFAEKKLIILDKSFTNQIFKERFLKDSQKFVNSKNTILFYEPTKILESNSLFKFLKKYGKSQEFNLLEGEKLRNWLKKEFLKYQKEVSPEIINKLINFIGNDLWRLDNEIKKLISYKFKKEIELKDIDLLVQPKIETDIFKAIDAVAQRNKKRAIALIHKHLEKGDNPLYILSMISFQFRNLLIIKALMEKYQSYYAVLKTSNLHPFIIKKGWEQAKSFTLLELKKIYQKIFQADLDIKTGKKETIAVLDLLIIEI